jgi:hypothetical protein
VIKETTEIAFSALFLDIYLKFITDGSLSITLYDKRNDFSLDYLNLPHFDLILIPVCQPLPRMEFIFSSVVVFTTSKGVN